MFMQYGVLFQYSNNDWAHMLRLLLSQGQPGTNLLAFIIHKPERLSFRSNLKRQLDVKVWVLKPAHKHFHLSTATRNYIDITHT